MKIAFLQTNVSASGLDALCEYAMHNETILGNRSAIVCIHGSVCTTELYRHTQKKIQVITVKSFDEVDNMLLKYAIDAIYIPKNGPSDTFLSQICINFVHDTFCVRKCGDRYACISQQISKESGVDWLPFIVNFPPHTLGDECLRHELGIPSCAVVLGSYGDDAGTSFNIVYVRECVSQLVRKYEHIWAIFMNTECWDDHPKIIHVENNWDKRYKARFVNTCTAMLHASTANKMFDMAVSEFSIMNKPVITCLHDDYTLPDIRHDKCLLYKNQQSLIDIVLDIEETAQTQTDWDSCAVVTCEDTMKMFARVFLDIPTFPYGSYKLSTTFKPDLFSDSLKRGMWESHLLRIFDTLVEKTHVVLDIGAHVGCHTVYLSDLAHTVHAFEPNPTNRYHLRYNVHHNNCFNVHVHPHALGDISQSRCSEFVNGIMHRNSGDNSFRHDLDGSTLLTTLDSFGLDNVNLIKLDVQGAEGLVLLGATHVLRHHRPMLIIELESYTLLRYSWNCSMILELLKNENYQVLLIDSVYPSDHLCIPNEQYDAFMNKYKPHIVSVKGSNRVNDGYQLGVHSSIKCEPMQ